MHQIISNTKLIVQDICVRILISAAIDRNCTREMCCEIQIEHQIVCNCV